MHTLSINCQLHYRVINATQFIFQLQIAEHPWQTIVNESFQLKPDLTFEQYHRDNALNRLIRVYAPEGDLIVQYNAEVQTYIPERDTTLKECEIQDLPSDTLFYLAPSRFCESDLIGIMVNHTFGDLPKGYTRVQAICDWIYNNILCQSSADIDLYLVICLFMKLSLISMQFLRFILKISGCFLMPHVWGRLISLCA